MSTRPALPAIAIAALFLASVPAPARASVAPSSFDAGIGWSAWTPNFSGYSVAAVPSLNAGWHLGSRVSLRSGLAYLKQQNEPPVTFRLPGTSTGNLRDLYTGVSSYHDRAAHYVPLSAGIRFYLKQDPSKAGGIFVEGAPALVAAWLPYAYPYSGHDRQLLVGAKGSVGARFGAGDGTRGEFGIAYYAVEPASTSRPIAYGSYVDRNERHFHLDALAVYVAFGFGK